MEFFSYFCISSHSNIDKKKSNKTSMADEYKILRRKVLVQLNQMEALINFSKQLTYKNHALVEEIMSHEQISKHTWKIKIYQDRLKQIRRILVKVEKKKKIVVEAMEE